MITEQEVKKLPEELQTFVNELFRVRTGQKHFLADRENPTEDILDIAYKLWIRVPPADLATLRIKYSVSASTFWRFLKELEPLKFVIADYLDRTPRNKIFWNRETETSDFENVRKYIEHSKRDGVRGYGRSLAMLVKVYELLGRKDPAKWNPTEVTDYLATLTPASASTMLDGIRQVAPHLKTEIKTGRFREKIARRKKDFFGTEVKMIIEALEKAGLAEDLAVWQFHITGGFREGSTDTRAGLCGITWSSFKEGFTRVDDYESKVRGGITWRDCPVNLFFKDLPEKLESMWISRGKPSDAKVIIGGYPALLEMYKRIRKALVAELDGKVEPSLLKELSTLRPHDADKIHVNLLWEAEVPLETTCGEYLGRGEGVGLVGRGWLEIGTVKKYYLSLSRRSDRFQKIRAKITDYSLKTFGGDS